MTVQMVTAPSVALSVQSGSGPDGEPAGFTIALNQALASQNAAAAGLPQEPGSPLIPPALTVPAVPADPAGQPPAEAGIEPAPEPVPLAEPPEITEPAGTARQPARKKSERVLPADASPQEELAATQSPILAATGVSRPELAADPAAQPGQPNERPAMPHPQQFALPLPPQPRSGVEPAPKQPVTLYTAEVSDSQEISPTPDLPGLELPSNQISQPQVAGVADPAPTPALPTQPASTVPELNWDHLVASIHLKQKTSQKTLTIQLRPDSYGKLQIRLEHSEQGLMTHLITDNAQTSVLLGSHVRHLQDLLAAKGFVCPQIEVSCQPQTLANDHSGQHPGHSPPQDHRPAPDVLPVKTARSPENLADRPIPGPASHPAVRFLDRWT
jgi:hypothetical protein